MASLGDLDGDGVTDLGVGALRDASAGVFGGAAHVLFLNANGTVKSSLRLASNTNGGPPLNDFAYFGASIAALGDLDGDGVGDLAVGASRWRQRDLRGRRARAVFEGAGVHGHHRLGVEPSIDSHRDGGKRHHPGGPVRPLGPRLGKRQHRLHVPELRHCFGVRHFPRGR